VVVRWTFSEAVKAMEGYPTASREEDVALADSLRLIEDAHGPSERNADRNGSYGVCVGCGKKWPCSVWVNAERLVVEWLVIADSEVWRRHQAKEPRGECMGCMRGWVGHEPGYEARNRPRGGVGTKPGSETDPTRVCERGVV
jgi:hypothetical protein